MENKKILIIEDEIPIADLIEYGLNKVGYKCTTANSGVDGMRKIEEVKPNLILLDWMLPDISGIDICKMVTEKNNIPIIMMTAKSDIEDKVLGLEYGAEDYITKPFDMREVIARIKIIFRRINQVDNEINDRDEEKIVIGDIEIIKNEHLVKKNNQIIKLTLKEYDLFVTLSENRGKIFSRDQLLNNVWGYEYVGDTRTVDIHIQRLRKKLGAEELIKTVFGVGYKIIK